LEHHRSTGRAATCLLACLALFAVAGCSPIALRTRAEPATDCHLALMSGSLERHPQTGLGIGTSEPEIMAVVWPFGYTARMDLATFVLVDEKGQIVAREHDRVNVGGGMGDEQGPNPMWHACGPVTVESQLGG
jgi:hypothetical protein